VEAIAGDMRDTTMWGHAMEGASAVYHTCPNVAPDELLRSMRAGDRTGASETTRETRDKEVKVLKKQRWSARRTP
jgi:GH24 family phage-related lysozyme (muramidase)